MPGYSVTEAKNKLSELIDRAVRGERVVITRRGRPVAELHSLQLSSRKITPADLDWLAARRVGARQPAEDADMLVSKMRDEWDC